MIIILSYTLFSTQETKQKLFLGINWNYFRLQSTVNICNKNEQEKAIRFLTFLLNDITNFSPFLLK